MKFEQLCIFLLAIHFSLYAEQFIYPVAAIDNEGKEILVVYQKSLDDIELWIWDSATKCAMKGLLSAYVPAGIKMLPSGAGFSFVDEGRLRVKNFYKRLPKTIAMYQPISKITDIQWISDDAFYFSAKEGNVYNIFSSNTIGEVQRCTSGKDSDYVYPSKIGRTIFCVERDKYSKLFRIVNFTWLLCAYDEKSVSLESKKVMFETARPISYLHMISDQEGFYLDYSAINSCLLEDLLIFSCCRIFKNSDQSWSTETMFEFKIPSFYVLGKESNRLYESIAPLLPDSKFVYFIDTNFEGKLELKKYDKQNKNVEIVLSSKRNDLSLFGYIAPLCIGKNIYTGFVFDDYDLSDRIIEIDGSIFVDLPEIIVEC